MSKAFRRITDSLAESRRAELVRRIGPPVGEGNTSLEDRTPAETRTEALNQLKQADCQSPEWSLRMLLLRGGSLPGSGRRR